MNPIKLALLVLLAFTFVVTAQNQTNYEISLPAHPFGVAVSQDQRWIFVSLLAGEKDQSPGIAVLRKKGGQIQYMRTISTPSAPGGIVLTHDGRTLIAAAVDSIVFFDAEHLETGAGDPAFQWLSDGPDARSLYLNVTADDKTLFVSDEGAQTITVIDLEKVRALGRDATANMKHTNSAGDAAAAIIGKIPVGIAPIAHTFSKDESWLFTTSEVALPAWGWPRVLDREGGKPGAEKVPEGAMIVIDVAKAKTKPAESVVARIPAGGSPVRSALSPDGHGLFVTARNSNALLVFDTDKLVKDPNHAKPVKITVGTSPVPVALVKGGKLAVVGNSNRFSASAEKSSTLTVLDTIRIGTQLDPKVGEISCGAFPREFYLTADGRTLFLTNFRSSTLQVIDVACLTGSLGM